MYMKKVFVLSLCIVCTVFSAVSAQEIRKDSIATTIADEDGPMMFKFEPEFVSEQLKKRAVFLEKRNRIDTMDISDRKRLRLIKQLYKGTNSKELQKALLTATKFEDAM